MPKIDLKQRSYLVTIEISGGDGGGAARGEPMCRDARHGEMCKLRARAALFYVYTKNGVHAKPPF